MCAVLFVCFKEHNELSVAETIVVFVCDSRERAASSGSYKHLIHCIIILYLCCRIVYTRCCPGWLGGEERGEGSQSVRSQRLSHSESQQPQDGCPHETGTRRPERYQ